MCYGENMPLDVLFVRDDDIPDLVQEDVCDLGSVGLNVVEEKRLSFAARGHRALVRAVQLLDFGRCQLASPCRTASSIGARNRCTASASRRPIRTCWQRFLAQHAVAAEVVVLSGSVEIAPRLGRADLICDLVSTGSTLRPIICAGPRQCSIARPCSSARRCRSPPRSRTGSAACLMRIDGVEQVKGSKYIMLHAPRSALAAISETAARQRGADGHSARRPRRPGGGARGVPGKRVLGDAGRPEGCGRDLGAGSPRRKDAGIDRAFHAHARLEIPVPGAAQASLAASGAAPGRGRHGRGARHHRGGAP